MGLGEKSDLVGLSDYDLWAKADADAIVERDRQIMLSGESQLNFEEVLTSQNGEKKWLSTSKVPLYNEFKEIVGTVGLFHDVTAYKEMEIELDDKAKSLVTYISQVEKANRDLKLTNIDLETFTYAASHDLKGPLITIKSFASLLKEKEGGNIDSSSMQILDMIIDSTYRMETLVNDMLDYAQAGTASKQLEAIDLNELVMTKVQDLNQLINSRSAKVNLNLPQIPVLCYSKLIGIVFYNLISKGIKFIESKEPIISCDFKEEPDSWVFSVEDNGVGIHSQYSKQIFEPFKRLVSRKI